MKTYSTTYRSILVASTIVLFASAVALAGHGGGGGGHFGGGGGYGGHSYGGGGYGGYHGYSGGYGGYHGGEWAGYHGGEWAGAGHAGAFSTPHSDFHPTRSNLASSAWSHDAAHSNWANRAGNVHNWANNTHPDWYHGNWHDHGDHYWHHWPSWWAAGWWGAGVLAGEGLADLSAPWSWGYIPYYNPYCDGPVVADGYSIDYSQPLALASGPTTSPDSMADQDDVDQQYPVSTQTTPADEAANFLDAARDAFMQGDYTTALTQCDKAIAKTPNDTVANELRGLILFAQHNYKQAAASLYAVLSVGPGWDWTTVCSLYDDGATYTSQLRALEDYVHNHPDSADARFVLAYQYLTCNHPEAAEAQYKKIVQLNPKDHLSAQILSALESSDTTTQTAKAATPAKPVAAASLVGDWTAKRSDGNAIALKLSSDGKYTWTYNRGNKPQSFAGDYSVADNLLVLKLNGSPTMVGQVTPISTDSFNFKLPGNNPTDPGLTFAK